MAKTNAVRILRSAGIEFRTVDYDVDIEDLSATAAAGKLGIEPSRMFKTLVVRGDRSAVFVCMVPGDRELDLKKAAAILGDRKAEMVRMDELQHLTGYVRGGCTPIGMKKSYPVYIDLTAHECDTVYISAGKRGSQIVIRPEDLITFTGALEADLCR